MKVGILDYGVGNIKSVYNAVKHVGGEPILVEKPENIEGFSHIIAPGVGNFGYVVEQFKQHDFHSRVKEYINAGHYYLGICVGMQMLFEGSEESENVSGLAIMSGKVEKMSNEPVNDKHRKIKLPHIGWSKLNMRPKYSDDKFVSGVSSEQMFYFVHSYTAKPSDEQCLVATVEYGVNDIAAIVNKGNAYGTQFHPERSGESGLNLINNFCNLS